MPRQVFFIELSLRRHTANDDGPPSGAFNRAISIALNVGLVEVGAFYGWRTGSLAGRLAARNRSGSFFL